MLAGGGAAGKEPTRASPKGTRPTAAARAATLTVVEREADIRVSVVLVGAEPVRGVARAVQVAEPAEPSTLWCRALRRRPHRRRTRGDPGTVARVLPP